MVYIRGTKGRERKRERENVNNDGDAGAWRGDRILRPSRTSCL